jgi:hypothetical protein
LEECSEDHIGSQIGQHSAQLHDRQHVLGGLNRADKMRQAAKRHPLFFELIREVAPRATDDGRVMAPRSHCLGHVADMDLRATQVVAAGYDVRDVDVALVHYR